MRVEKTRVLALAVALAVVCAPVLAGTGVVQQSIGGGVYGAQVQQQIAPGGCYVPPAAPVACVPAAPVYTIQAAPVQTYAVQAAPVVVQQQAYSYAVQAAPVVVRQQAVYASPVQFVAKQRSFASYSAAPVAVNLNVGRSRGLFRGRSGRVGVAQQAVAGGGGVNINASGRARVRVR